MRVKTKSARSFIVHYLAPRWLTALTATLSSLLLAVSASAMTLLLGPALERLLAPADLGASVGNLRLGRYQLLDSWATQLLPEGERLWELLPWLVVALAACKAGLAVLQYGLWERCSELAVRALRLDVLRAFIYCRPGQRQASSLLDEKEAELAAALANDVRCFREYLVHFYGGIPRELLQLLCLGAVLGVMAPRLFLVFTLGLVPLLGLLRRLGKTIMARSSVALATHAELSEWLQCRLLGIETIKHYGTELLEEQGFAVRSAAHFTRFLKAARVKARTGPFMEGSAALAMVATLLLALFELYRGRLTPTAALSFFAGLAWLSQSAAVLSRYFNSNRENLAGVERLRSLLAALAAETVTKLERVAAPVGTPHLVSCSGLAVHYAGTKTAALSDFCFNFAAGRVYGIYGPSGSGKSSLLQAILGLQPLAAGQVHFHGACLEAHGVAYVPQAVSSQLLSASLLSQVSYPDLAPDRKRARDAVASAGLDGLVKELPHGLDSEFSIAAGGSTGSLALSGGQAQRLLLARLFYMRARLVLIDEGTSALDPELERWVLERLALLAREGATLLLVSHRTLPLHHVDQILRLEAGRLMSVEAGARSSS